MFTVKAIHNIDRIFKLGSKTNGLPFKWNPKSSRLDVGSTKQRIVMVIIMIYMYWEAFYQVYRIAIGHHNKSVSLTKYMKLVELFATRLTALLIQTITFVYCVDAKNFFNHLLNMNAKFIEIYGQHHVKDSCSKIFAFWYWFVRIHPILAVSVYAMENTDDRYWHGALLPTGIQPFFVPLFILVEYWISVFSELGGLFLGCVMLSYYKTTPVWMNELTIRVRESKTNCEQVITLYRAMLILSRMFNNAYSWIFATGSFAFMIDLIICLTCTLRLTPTLGFSGLEFPIGSIAMILVLEFTLRPTANLTSPSTEFLAAFSAVASVKRCGNKRRGHVKNMEKERKKWMKMKQCRRANSPQVADSHTDVFEYRSPNHTPTTTSSRWDEVVLKIRVRKNRVQATAEGPKGASNADDIEAIRTDELDRVLAVSSERERSLILRATAKSMYPMVVKCGIFFEFEHSSIFNFYSTVLGQTISALLLI